MARPPKSALDHLLLYAMVRSELQSGRLSERNACERVRQRYYRHRTKNGFWQTWLELSKIKPVPGAQPNRWGYIDGHQWKARSGARGRMIKVHNLLALILNGRRPPGMNELTYQKMRVLLGED